MKNSFKMQFREIAVKKTTVVTYLAVLLFVAVNFSVNLLENREIQYVSQMYDPIKKLTWSSWSVSGYYLMQLFPLLAVFPTATSWISEKNSGIHAYIRSRSGEREYWYGKMGAAFVISFLIFTVPFLLELLLSIICFPMQSAGDPSGFSYLITVEEGTGYILPQLFYSNKVLYAAVFVLIIGCVAGGFAVFNLFVTTLPGFRYKIFTFFPIYIFLFLLTVGESWISPNESLYYGLLLTMFESGNANYLLFAAVIVGMLAISFLLAERKIREGGVR